MMDIDNGWFGTLNNSSTDHQQQTYVTKHDLELLHKKIIATDLIVQKYQDANRALLRLQAENDDLKQQIEQITNECCIFGKQVTECTQECDNLKEQIGLLNAEKRELHQQLRLLQDENTNNYHEIMVLKQYESLKEINDQITKTVDRQQKQITKLQLQVQRKSPIVYKPNKSKQEPSETDIALTNSQKSVRELKLALGRLMNFIQISKIEIPTALHIRPVLKAHDINDDFLEIEGEFIRKPVKKVSKPVVSQIDEDDDDDDDENGDFIDVTHTVQTPFVNTTNPSVDIIEETPTLSKSSTRRQQKKKEIPKTKTKKKSSTKTRRQNDISISENPSTKLDDLANELEIALLQSNQQESISQLSSFLSDDDDEDRIQKSDKQQIPILTYTPIILQPPTIYPETNSTISFTPKLTKSIPKEISFFSDDDNEEISPIPQQQPPYTRSANERTISSLQVDRIIPMEHETSNTPTKYMSSLSEDDDDNESLPTASASIGAHPYVDQEYGSSLKLNESILDKDNDNKYKSHSSDKHPTTTPILTTDILQKSLSSTEDSLSNNQIEIITESIQDSFFNEKDRSIPTTPVNILDSNRIEIVLRLLHVLTQVPISLKPLRLVRRRIQQKKISKEQITIPIEDKPDNTNQDTIAIEIVEHLVRKPVEEQLNFNEAISTAINIAPECSFTVPMEEQSKSTETINKTLEIQVSKSAEVHLKPIEKNNTTAVKLPAPDQIEEQSKFIEEVNTILHETPKDSFSILMEEQSTLADENDTIIPKTLEDHIPISKEEPLQPVEERHNTRTTNRTISKIHQEQQNLVKDDQFTLFNESSESPSPIEPIQFKLPLPPSILAIPKQSLLKPFQISIISRLLNILTTLPVKPLILPVPLLLQKRKRKPVVNKPSITNLRRTSSRISRSPTRMQTRSLNSIRACITRCNQPTIRTKKRTATELILPPPPTIPKRMKSIKLEQTTYEYDSINRFINLFSKEINDELNKILERKLHEDILLFNDNLYGILSELMINKCDVILPLVKHLHPYEESIKILLTYIHRKSSIFQQHFTTKLNQIFEYEIKQQPISNNRIKVLNRLFFLTCSIFASSSVIIYARLFDIAYYLSHDILIDVLSFISNTCSSLISIDSQTNSSNILLHQILFDFVQENQFNISFDYLENLLVAYHRYTHDQDDLIRSFILISRYQSWLWCSNDLCSKFFFPLLNQINDRYQQRETILIILQYVLFIYKDNQDFKRDIIFHDQIKQLLSSLKTMNSYECTVRDKILFIIHTCC